MCLCAVSVCLSVRAHVLVGVGACGVLSECIGQEAPVLGVPPAPKLRDLVSWGLEQLAHTATTTPIIITAIIYCFFTMYGAFSQAPYISFSKPVLLRCNLQTGNPYILGVQFGES